MQDRYTTSDVGAQYNRKMLFLELLPLNCKLISVVVKAQNGSSGRLLDWLDCWVRCLAPWHGGRLSANVNDALLSVQAAIAVVGPAMQALPSNVPVMPMMTIARPSPHREDRTMPTHPLQSHQCGERQLPLHPLYPSWSLCTNLSFVVPLSLVLPQPGPLALAALTALAGGIEPLTKFGKKDFIMRCSAVKCFLCAHLLVYRMGMHVCQRKPEEVEVEASNFMRLIGPLLFGPHCNRRFILNIDQTPVYFLMSTKKTLELVEKKPSISAR
jgi:hypothetical protein